MGSDFVGDVPLTKKILAALTTGEHNGFSFFFKFAFVGLVKKPNQPVSDFFHNTSCV